MATAYHYTTDLIEAPDLHTATGSGRAVLDERGNSIWEWQTAPGVYSRDISVQQLQELEASNLHLQDGIEHNAEHNDEQTLWSRNARRAQNARAMRGTAHQARASGFDMFLKRIGLAA